MLTEPTETATLALMQHHHHQQPPQQQECLRRERESLDGRRQKFFDDKAVDGWRKEVDQEAEAEDRELSELARQDIQVCGSFGCVCWLSFLSVVLLTLAGVIELVVCPPHHGRCLMAGASMSSFSLVDELPHDRAESKRKCDESTGMLPMPMARPLFLGLQHCRDECAPSMTNPRAVKNECPCPPPPRARAPLLAWSARTFMINAANRLTSLSC